LTQPTEFKPFLSDLNVVANEEGYGEHDKRKEIQNNLNGLLGNSQMAAFGSFVSKDKKSEIFFLHDTPLVSPQVLIALSPDFTPFYITNSKFMCQAFFSSKMGAFSFCRTLSPDQGRPPLELRFFARSVPSPLRTIFVTIKTRNLPSKYEIAKRIHQLCA
jgi:hypothetical protein